MNQQNYSTENKPHRMVDAVGAYWTLIENGVLALDDIEWTIHRDVEENRYTIEGPNGRAGTATSLADALIEAPKLIAAWRIPDYEGFKEHLLNVEECFIKDGNNFGRASQSWMTETSPDLHKMYGDLYAQSQQHLVRARAFALGLTAPTLNEWYGAYPHRKEYRLTFDKIGADPSGHIAYCEDFETLDELHGRLRAVHVPAEERLGRRAVQGSSTFGTVTWSWFPLALLDARGVSRELTPAGARRGTVSA